MAWTFQAAARCRRQQRRMAASRTSSERPPPPPLPELPQRRCRPCSQQVSPTVGAATFAVVLVAPFVRTSCMDGLQHPWKLGQQLCVGSTVDALLTRRWRGADKGKGLTLGASLAREGGAPVYKMWAHNGTQARPATPAGLPPAAVLQCRLVAGLVYLLARVRAEGC